VDELSAVVHGEVQGVGMRWAVRARALEMGLTGTVRNLPDGTVEVIAQGTRPQLDAFVQWLRLSSPGAVHGVDSRYQPAEQSYARFEVIR
jgi:acylphosphatase